MSEGIIISKSDFRNNRLKCKGLAIVECYNSLSGRMQIMEPVFNKLKERFNKNITHFRIDTDKNHWIKEQFYILQEPVYLLFKDGQLVDRLDCMLPYRELAGILEKYLNIKK